ncbi:hypothetical protein [Streptomonospora arabica]|uniref:Uncharacterized protein n=1 Tax=Streptomonospora arabica TaxID=412417 RepID=A0ABV9SR28_9ACTN
MTTDTHTRTSTTLVLGGTGKTALLGEVLDGRNTPTADGVRRALGREPRDFADFARGAAAAGAWHTARTEATGA